MSALVITATIKIVSATLYNTYISSVLVIQYPKVVWIPQELKLKSAIAGVSLCDLFSTNMGHVPLPGSQDDDFLRSLSVRQFGHRKDIRVLFAWAKKFCILQVITRSISPIRASRIAKLYFSTDSLSWLFDGHIKPNSCRWDSNSGWLN